MAAEDIKKLITLQQTDLQADSLAKAKKAMPQKFAEAERSLEAARTELETHKEKHRRLLVGKKELETDLKETEDAIRKHQGELNSVKSNDAYQALLKEIATCTAEKDRIETEILGLLDCLEESSAREKPLQEALAAAQSSADGQKTRLQTEEAELDGQIAALAAKRAGLAATVDADLLEKYESIRTRREGLAICPTLDRQGRMVCGGCNTALTQHMCGQVLRKDSTNYCEECQRIIYSPLALLGERTNEA